MSYGTTLSYGKRALTTTTRRIPACCFGHVLYTSARTTGMNGCSFLLYSSTTSKAQTPLHGHVVQHYQRTPPTDELTTILQQICRIAMPEPNTSTCQDVGMWQIFVRWWGICCTTSYRIVVSSSVGGVRSHCPCSVCVYILIVAKSAK